MNPGLRWLLAGLLGVPLAGCVYYPDAGYVRGDGYGSTGAVYYESAPYYDGYYATPYGGYYGGAYYSGSYYGYWPQGYSSLYWPGYYSIGIGVHDHHHGWHGGRGWSHGRDDARPSPRRGPQPESRRRR